MAGVKPVLVDVGSAGTSHAVWDAIASESIVVGFDADSRNSDQAFGKGYAHAIMVNKAVVPCDDIDTVEFILTRYPSCSSMLEPDMDALQSFSFRDYFEVVKRATVPATSLNRVIEAESLDHIHWLKLDSQGADLRLLKSLSGKNRDNLLSVDIEPGLIHAYKEEDLFIHCHDWLLNHGFWLSRLGYQSYPKVQPESVATLAENIGMDVRLLMKKLPNAPTAVEGRYLREVGWLKERNNTAESLILAAVFGILDGQFGYAFDIAILYTEHFGEDGHAEVIKEIVRAAVNGRD